MLKESVRPRVFFSIVSCASVLSLLMAVLSPFLFLPCSVVSFALLFRYEPHKGRKLSFLLPVLGVGLCVLVDPISVPYAVFAVCAAWVLSSSLRVGRPKFDAALYMTGICLLAMLVSLWLSAAQATSSWTPAAAIEYYTELAVGIKEEILQSIDLSGLDAEYAESYTVFMSDFVDAVFGSVYALAAIYALWIVGFAMKLFSALTGTLDVKGHDAVRRFRFAPPLPFAYFHFILFVANLLFASGSGVLALTVNNLYLFFTVMFAYVGIKYLLFVMSRTQRPGRNRTLLLLAIVMFFTVAFHFLAIEGAVAVITANRLYKHHDRSGEDQP